MTHPYRSSGFRRVQLVAMPLLVALMLLTPNADAKRPKPPPEGDVAERAKLLVQAIAKNDPALALPFFFPKDAFRKVKGIKNPDKYFDYLIRVYELDIRTMRDQLKSPDTVSFVSFDLGRRRNWIEKRKEANRLPYYATYKSRLVVNDGGKNRTLRVRVMITWDGQWYVTHLLRKRLNEKLWSAHSRGLLDDVQNRSTSPSSRSTSFSRY